MMIVSPLSRVKPWLVTLSLVASIILISLPAAARVGHSAAMPGATLTFMHFNDDYQLTPTGGLGGMDLLAGQIVAQRQMDPQSMLFFAGDLLSPSVESAVFKGNQMLAALNRLGVTAATLGNHEFDHGDAALVSAVSASHFPWVSSNVLVTASGQPFTGTVSTLVKVVHGVKIGMLGLLTPETEIISSPGHELTIAPVIAAARKAVAALAAQGATVIVAITHQNLSDDIALAQAVPQINLIVGGHDHTLWDSVVGHTLIVKAESDAHYLGVTTVTVNGAGHVVSMVDQPMLINSNNVTADPAMTKLVTSYESRLSAQLNRVLGTSTLPLDARESVVRQKESALGDFIADAQRTAAGADVAIMNGGGIRTDAVHPAGKITRKDILAFLPFGNVSVVVKLTGKDLLAALENGVSQWKDVAGRFPQVSGIRFSWSPAKPVGHRVSAVTVGGQPLSLTKLYTLATNDYMLGGGDGYASLANGTVLVGPNDGALLATVVMNAVQAQGTLTLATDGRITQLP